MIGRVFVLCAQLLLTVGVGFYVQAQTTANPLHGAWSGFLHYGNEMRAIGLRFALDEHETTVVFIDAPDLKFRNLGPIHLKQTGSEYQAFQFTFSLDPNNHTVSGVWSFDGHEIPFELVPGALPAPASTEVAGGPVAKPVWTFRTGGPIWSSPATAGHVVYFGSNDGNLYAVETRSGKPLWHFTTGGPVMGTPTVDGRYVYVLSDDGFLYKLGRAGGQLVWKFDTHGGKSPRDMVGSQAGGYDTETSAAAIAGDTVYVGSADKRLYAIDAETGHERWHFDTQGIVRSTPAVSDGVVFFGSRDHYIYAVDPKTGSMRWRYDTLREVVSSPLVDRGTVYIGSRSSDLLALDAVSGKVKWKSFYWSSWVESSARIRDGILYIGSSDAQQLFAIDPRTGQRIWSFDTNGSPWSTPAVTRKQVYIGAAGVMNYFIDHRGGFFAVDRATGKEVWQYPMPVIPNSSTYGVASSPAVQDGLVFFGGLDGVFYAFAER
jgi:outer membrane protein assembly factor BamB